MSMKRHWAVVGLALCAACVAPGLQAQDEPDFEGDAYEETIEVADERPPAWVPFYEALLRGDRVTGLPAGRDDLERVRARLRAGGIWNIQRSPQWRIGAALEGGIGTGANKDSLINNDVEDVDGLALDQLWFSWRFSASENGRGELLLGKAALPLELSPLLWDADLRPLSLSLGFSGGIGDFDRWSLTVGAFEPDPLGERGARLNAIQFGWDWRPGAPTHAGVRLAYLDWSDLDEFAGAGLGRGNTLLAGHYVHDYRLLDAQLYLRRQVGDKWLEARLDRATNLDAEAQDDGTRISLVYGDRFDPNQPGWEFGWAWQRQQRDAVLAAVTADDWWFHTAARGHMPWVGYGFNPIWSLRIAGFFETRDGLDERTRRLLIDIEARW